MSTKRINEITAFNTEALTVDFSAHHSPAVTADGLSSEKVHHVIHRGFKYRVGRWDDWNGPYFIVEESTGIIYRGTIEDIKSYIKLCSDCAE